MTLTVCLGLASAPVALAADTGDADSACSEATSTLALDATLGDAETAFRGLDAAAFSAAVDRLDAALPCAAERIPPTVVARIHRAHGVRAFLADDQALASAAFAAARATDPRLTMDLVPEGHELELLWGVSATAGETLELDPPAEGTVYLDGEAELLRPVDRPTLAQWVVDDAPRFTRWTPPGAAIPDYPIATDTGPTADARRRRKRRRAGLFILGTGVGLGLVAGGLNGAAAASKASFEADQPDWDRDDLNQARQRTNTLGTAAGVTALTALATGGVGLAMQW